MQRIIPQTGTLVRSDQIPSTCSGVIALTGPEWRTHRRMHLHTDNPSTRQHNATVYYSNWATFMWIILPLSIKILWYWATQVFVMQLMHKRYGVGNTGILLPW